MHRRGTVHLCSTLFRGTQLSTRRFKRKNQKQSLYLNPILLSIFCLDCLRIFLSAVVWVLKVSMEALKKPSHSNLLIHETPTLQPPVNYRPLGSRARSATIITQLRVSLGLVYSNRCTASFVKVWLLGANISWEFFTKVFSLVPAHYFHSFSAPLLDVFPSQVVFIVKLDIDWVAWQCDTWNQLISQPNKTLAFAWRRDCSISI